MATNSQNSFKKLMEEEEQQFPHPPPEIEQNVMGNARNIKFMGDVVELYLSRFFEMLISFFGGTTQRKEDWRKGNADIDPHSSPEGTPKKD